MKCGYDLLSIFYGENPIRTIHNQTRTVHNWTISEQTIYSVFEFSVWALKSIENAIRLRTPLEKVQY